MNIDPTAGSAPTPHHQLPPGSFEAARLLPDCLKDLIQYGFGGAPGDEPLPGDSTELPGDNYGELPGMDDTPFWPPEEDPPFWREDEEEQEDGEQPGSTQG